MPKVRAKAKGRISASARVQKKKPIKAGSTNIGGSGGIFVGKVIKIRKAMENERKK